MSIEKKRTNFLQRLEYFLKCKIGLKESNAQSWRTDVLHYCNKLLIGLNLNFLENIDILTVTFYRKICSLRVTFGNFSQMQTNS